MKGSLSTPLEKKLGLTSGQRVCILDGPRDLVLDLIQKLPESDFIESMRGSRPFDVVICFVKTRKQLERRFAMAAPRLEPSGGLWMAWPKKASKLRTELDFESVQAVGLAGGLVDNKVCSIDEVWSGLRFVYRLKDRFTRATEG